MRAYSAVASRPISTLSLGAGPEELIDFILLSIHSYCRSCWYCILNSVALRDSDREWDLFYSNNANRKREAPHSSLCYPTDMGSG